MSSAETQDLTQPIDAPNHVRELLRAGGWSDPAGRDDFVGKCFNTAVGMKRASAWCYPDSSDGRHWINGCYYSEGRNVLSGCCVCIPEGADGSAVSAAVERFIALAELNIGESYAMRLMRF